MPIWQLMTILDDVNFSYAIRKTLEKMKTGSQQKQMSENAKFKWQTGANN